MPALPISKSNAPANYNTMSSAKKVAAMPSTKFDDATCELRVWKQTINVTRELSKGNSSPIKSIVLTVASKRTAHILANSRTGSCIQIKTATVQLAVSNSAESFSATPAL